MNLAELFHPIPVSDILDAADRHELVHFRRGASAVCESVMNWDIAAHVAERRAEQTKVLRAFRDGGKIVQEMLKTSRNSPHFSGASVRRLARQGASIVASEIEDFSPALRALANDAERHFGCPTIVGIVATFGPGYALQPHWDPEDIVCVQVAGWKTWKILGKPCEGRVGEKLPGSGKYAPTEITRKFTMEPGDLMMIPRGYWHCCESDVDNLQLGLIVRRRMGADFIQDLAKKVLEDPLFHRAIPLSRDPARFAALEAQWLARFQELAGPGSLLRFVDSENRAPEIPFCFDHTPPDPCDSAAVLTLATRRPIAPPEAPGEPLRMGGVTLKTTPAILAVVDVLNREVSLPTPEIFNRLASAFARDEIAQAILALDESCLARLTARPSPDTIDS